MNSSLVNGVPAGGAKPSTGLSVLIVAAVTLPTLLAFNQPPSPTLFNQLAALAIWGWVVVTLASRSRTPPSITVLWPLMAGLALTAVAVLWSWGPGALPSGLALSALGLIAAAALLVASGARGDGSSMQAFCVAWVVAGVIGTAIGIVQVFAPGWADGDWIARSGLTGRAVGNLRQPNHLSSVLLSAAVAVVPLVAAGRLRAPWGAALFALLVFGITLTGSRTGGVGVVVLALWGVMDRRLGGRLRALLISAPVLYGISWLVMWAWAQATEHTFGAAERLAEGDLSGSRFAIWRDTLVLVARHPWAGVGFGEFNLAWTLTPFPERARAFFDHTHNLPLQLMAELGIPLALTVMAFLATALWQAWRRSWAVEGDSGFARAAFVMVLMMGLHSQLEYPLWYAYFLLPTAWAWGYCLASEGRALTPALSTGHEGGLEAPVRERELLRSRRWLQLGGLALAIGSAVALVDYLRVVQIFAPPAGAGPLAERIESGRRSIFFAHHADYAAATTAAEPAAALQAFDRASHYLLDTRLMTAWARAFDASGDADRARHVAERLREFHNPAADEFFAPCSGPEPRPFQCQPPARVPDWREFR
jgi:O-antigen ligase